MQRMTKLQAWLLAFELCSNRSNLIEPGVAVCLSYGGLLYSTAGNLIQRCAPAQRVAHKRMALCAMLKNSRYLR